MSEDPSWEGNWKARLYERVRERGKVETVPGQKHTKEITPPSNETQVDHVILKIKGGKELSGNNVIKTSLGANRRGNLNWKSYFRTAPWNAGKCAQRLQSCHCLGTSADGVLRVLQFALLAKALDVCLIAGPLAIGGLCVGSVEEEREC
jgi:hypothetical protein